MAGAEKGEKEARRVSSCRYALPRPSLVEFRSDLRSWRTYSRVSAPVFAASHADRSNSAKPAYLRVATFPNSIYSRVEGGSPTVHLSVYLLADKAEGSAGVTSGVRIEGILNKEEKKWRGRSLSGDEGIELDGETL